MKRIRVVGIKDAVRWIVKKQTRGNRSPVAQAESDLVPSTLRLPPIASLVEDVTAYLPNFIDPLQNKTKETKRSCHTKQNKFILKPKLNYKSGKNTGPMLD